MSVINPQTHCWTAPVIAGHQSIAIVGSWVPQHAGTAREWHLSDSRLCHLRIGVWKQQLQHDIVPAALDLSIRKYDMTHKCEIELKMVAAHIPTRVITDMLPQISKMLNRHPHVRTVLTAFQEQFNK